MPIVLEPTTEKCIRCHHPEADHIDDEAQAFQTLYAIGTCTTCEPYEPCGHVTLQQQLEEYGGDAHDVVPGSTSEAGRWEDDGGATNS